MASLKEVKTRINSVISTRKITSAMKMVASSKLHHAQLAIENMRPYETRLEKIMASFINSIEGDISSPYAVKREVRRVALVVYTSNSSLCGGFNGNIIKALHKKITSYQNDGIEIVKIVPMGKKALEAVRKLNYTDLPDYSNLLDHPAYEPAAKIAAELMQLYETGKVDQVEILYHHFKNTATQILTEEVFLPISLDHSTKQEEEATNSYALDYIIEPSKEELIQQLIPKTLHLKLYTAMLDSLASEHAARVIAMQVATDNADELLNRLTLTYNKTRQQAITTELLDIVGGSMQ
ncbi:F0F1 ATP synthase subunit gamma [gut metagenome]|uniref:F0F1 ATP synthase subunit gamma n=1 Tax=gut metagenome TaxID=749906 RepID=J9H5T4_9ZZZZ